MENSVLVKQKNSFALQDRASSLAPIFLHVSGKNRPKMDVNYEYDGMSIHFSGADVLDHIEQSILLAIISLAPQEVAEKGDFAFLPQDTSHLPPSPLFDHGTVGDADAFGYGDRIAIKTTMYRVLKTAGRGQGSDSRKRLREALKRLAGITYYVCVTDEDGHEREFSQRFLSYDLSTKTDEIFISLNGIFTRALTSQHSRIDINERNQLGAKNGVALLLHAHFSSCINKGRSFDFNVDSLVRRFSPEVNENNVRKLRQKFKNGIEKIGSTLDGWNVSKTGKGEKLVFTVERKALKKIR